MRRIWYPLTRPPSFLGNSSGHLAGIAVQRAERLDGALAALHDPGGGPGVPGLIFDTFQRTSI